MVEPPDAASRDGLDRGSDGAEREPEARVVAAWRAWLGALGTDADAALAASMAYDALDEPSRTRWLDALERDAAALGTPKVALYAPLLAVERDPARLTRMRAAIGVADGPSPDSARERALRARTRDGEEIAVLVLPLYLDFVQVLACRHSRASGFTWVRYDPVASAGDAPRDGAEIDGALLEVAAFDAVVEDLAHAVLAQRRRGRPMPEAIAAFAHLFGPRLGSCA